MQHRTSYKKIYTTLGGLAVFIIGAVLGSFLVLGSGTSSGKSFYLHQSNGAEPQDAGSQTDTTAAAENNRTAELFAALNKSAVRVGTTTKRDRAEAAAYIEQEITALFPVIPSNSVQISDEVSPARYAQTMDGYYQALSLLFQKVLEGSLSLPTISDELRAELEKTAQLYVEAETEMQDLLVPPQYAPFHQQSLRWVGATENLIQDGLLASDDDPFRMLIALGGLDDIQVSILTSFAELERIKSEAGL